MEKAFYQFGKLYSGKDLVLGMPGSVVFAHGSWQGFLISDHCKDFEQMFEQHGEWRTREEAEADDNWQQVIPFGVFRCGNMYLELKRAQQGVHSGLYNKYSLGVGGHVMKPEMEQMHSLGMWMKEKFLEEIEYEAKLQVNCLGVINDNSDELGRRHLGLVYLLQGEWDQYRAKKHAESRLVKLADITDEDLTYMDRWSQMIYRQLRDLEEY